MVVAKWNACGVKNKIIDLETFLKPRDQFKLRGFQVVRSDSVGQRGGGVAVCVRSTFAMKQLDIVSNLEAAGVEIEVAGEKRCFVEVYRPPQIHIEDADLDALFVEPNTIPGGDWNAEHPRCGNK